MVQVGNVLVSFDVLTKPFACDLAACHGACCVEGDAGAPVTLDEVARLEALLPEIEADLTDEARDVIARQGVAYTDPSGELVTSIVHGKHCVFCQKPQPSQGSQSTQNSHPSHSSQNPQDSQDSPTLCAIEKAYREGRIAFQKPLSCHLYPIRVSRFGECVALNYNRWDICQSAVLKGQREGTPLYRYLREPLVRAFGQAWYDELELVTSELHNQHLI